LLHNFLEDQTRALLASSLYETLTARRFTAGAVGGYPAIMWRRLLVVLGVAVSTAAGASIALSDRASPPAHASSAPRDDGPTVAIFVTKPGALHTSLYFAKVGGAHLSTPVATFSHPLDAAVQGAVIPGSRTALAVVEDAPGRDKSFNSVLLRVAPHEPPERLCDDVVFGTRPLVMPSGRVFVARGKAGVLPPDASIANLRVDELSVDEVLLETGALRTVHTYSGYLTFFAGSFHNEILLYRVSRAGADIVGVDADAGALRVIVPKLPAFARDFSVDAASGALVFRGRHETNTKVWTVERVDLASGKTARLFESPSMTLAPHVLPAGAGAVAYNPYSQSGLAILGSSADVSVQAPLGAGIDVLVATSPDGAWVAAQHTRPGELSVPFALNTKTGRAASLPSLAGARAVVAGFVSGEEASR
jgi:hypothetical protein